MVNLAYDDRGDGEPVLFIAGQGGVGRTWEVHQAPAFRAAGYRVITFDNRGVGATANADGFTTATMVADTAELIEKLEAAPVRIVATSMGSYIAQELMLARPELVSQAALMATRGRHDRAREFFRTAEEDFVNAGVQLPPSYEAKQRLLENFSPKTLNDDEAIRDWIEHIYDVARKVDPWRACPVRRCAGERSAARLQGDHHSGIGDRICGRSRDAPTPRRRGGKRPPKWAIPRDRRHRPSGLSRTAASGEFGDP